MFFSALTPIVLPSRSFALLIEPLPATRSESQASFVLGAAWTPCVRIFTGSFFDLAIISGSTEEKPMLMLPLTTAAVTSAPPCMICGFSVRFSALKKPFCMPR